MGFPPVTLTPPTLTNYQFWLNSFTFGAGTAAGYLSITGLAELAPIRSADIPRARDHGELIGLDLYGGRDFTINYWTKTDGVSLQDTLENLAAATVVGLMTEQPMWFQLPNYPLLCVMCRCRKRAGPIDATYSAANIALPVAQFHATDPRVYAAAQSATVGLTVPSAGMTFPATFPLTFGATTPTGVTVTNAGNTEMRPILVITGPCTNPTIQNATINGTPALSFSNPNQVSYTVMSGDQMVIDTDLHTVLYYVGGVTSGLPPAPRPSWLVPGSTWWNLPPGPNLVQFRSGDSAAVAGTCQIQWASAYML